MKSLIACDDYADYTEGGEWRGSPFARRRVSCVIMRCQKVECEDGMASSRSLCTARRFRFHLLTPFAALLLATVSWGQELPIFQPHADYYFTPDPHHLEPDWRSGVLTDDDWSPHGIIFRDSESEGPAVEVPEPLLFDLVRPLGPRRGEIEFNTLAIFPWRAVNRDLQTDPVGPGPGTVDRQGIEWAPEVEIAIADNFAIEFEFPFEGSVLELYKLGLQWTIGTAFDNRYIHGFQVLIEPTVQWERWNSTLLYLGGIRFDETWSALLMVGGRMDMEGPNNSDTFEALFNASLFADISESAKVGLESNYASKVDGSSQFVLVPQFHYEFAQNFEVQSGVGLGVFSEGYEQSFVLRVIYSR